MRQSISGTAESSKTCFANRQPDRQPDREDAMPTTSAPLPRIETETMRRITWRLLPFFMLCYFISYVDRVNAGFAALQMNKDLGLTQAAFGAGGGLFYIAYILFEVPSNLAMQKVGARVWIA